MAVTTRERLPLVEMGIELAEVGGFMLLGNKVARPTPALWGLRPPLRVVDKHSLEVLGVLDNARALQGVVGPALSLRFTLMGLGMIVKGGLM